MLWKGDHVRVVLAPKDRKDYLRSSLVKYPLVLGRCVLDDDDRGKVRSKPVHLDCVNRFQPLTSQKASTAVILLVVCVVVRILIR